ncbi:hypothetical protein [Metarhizobium album]|nr:hypothetical protein [Rhizobium album]
MSIEHIVGKISDATGIKLFDAIEQKFGVDSKSFRIAGIVLDDADLQRISDTPEPTYSITECKLHIAGSSVFVKLTRTPSHGSPAYFDQITIEPSTNANRPSAAAVLDIEDIIRSFVRLPGIDAKSPTADSIQGVMEREIGALADLHHKMMADAHTLREGYEREALETRAAIDAEMQAELTALKQREKEGLEQLASERAELDDRLKEFDSSEHMRARRKLREDISTQVQTFLKEPSVPRSSTSKLIGLIVLCIAGAGAAGIFAFESFQAFVSQASSTRMELANLLLQIRETSPEAADKLQQAVPAGEMPGSSYLLWLLALRGVILTVVSIGFVAYLIALLRQSHDEDVRSHRELQRYGMDINRASWVIETAMEMTTKEGATLPEKWVEGACHGLFSSGASDGNVTKLEALGSLMGLAPDVSIGPDGTHVKFTGKATKQAAKES